MIGSIGEAIKRRAVHSAEPPKARTTRTNSFLIVELMRIAGGGG